MEFTDSIKNCKSLSTLDSNCILWHYIKVLVADNKYITNFIYIANTCINLSFWSLHLTSIIIPKLNKLAYDSPKIFHPIVLLNTLSKLIEKVISERIQIQSISNNFIHLN